MIEVNESIYDHPDIQLKVKKWQQSSEADG